MNSESYCQRSGVLLLDCVLLLALLSPNYRFHFTTLLSMALCTNTQPRQKQQRGCWGSNNKPKHHLIGSKSGLQSCFTITLGAVDTWGDTKSNCRADLHHCVEDSTGDWLLCWWKWGHHVHLRRSVEACQGGRKTYIRNIKFQVSSNHGQKEWRENESPVRAIHFHGGQKKSRPKVCQGTDSSENFVVDFVEYQSSEDVDEDSPDGHWKQMDGYFEGREAENVLHEQR